MRGRTTLSGVLIGAIITLLVPISSVIGPRPHWTNPEAAVMFRDHPCTVNGQRAPVSAGILPDSLTFTAEADAWVEESKPNTNFGVEPTLFLDGDPGAAAEAYLRFTVDGVSGSITNARLRMRTTSNSWAATVDGPAVYGTGTAWSETGVTWKTKPALTSGLIADVGALSADTWVVYDVTALVTADGTYSFALVPTSTDAVQFSAREGAHPPQLILELGEMAGPTPLPTSTATLVPSAPIASPESTAVVTEEPPPAATRAPVPTATSRRTAESMFRGNPAHTGRQPGPGPEGEPIIRWRFPTSGGISSSPAIVAGIVYVGSFDGHVYGIDAESGMERWRFQTGDEVSSSPAVVGGAVYIGSVDGNLYALDAETGTQLWRFPTEGAIGASPAVEDGLVYIGSWDGSLYAVDAAIGAERWRIRTGVEVFSSPAVADGLVYVGGLDGVLSAVDAMTGADRWRSRLDASVYSSPAVAGGAVYVGTAGGSVYALDIDGGETRWQFSTGARVSSSPAVVAGIVYVGSDDGNLYALDAETGAERWRLRTGAEVFSSPVVADGTVYVGSRDGFVYAVDAATGTERWRVEIGDEIYSSPAVADGVVYVGSLEGALYAIAGSRLSRSIPELRSVCLTNHEHSPSLH